MRFAAGIPFLLAVGSFVLAMLALLAGKDKGFMEDYHIVMFNTSELGHNLVPTPTSGGNGPTSTSGGSGIGGFFSSLVASATAAVGSLESDLASIEGDIADKLAKELGIRQFYSLHVMDLCEGDFTPNATAHHAGYNVTNCTKPMDTSFMNISKLLDDELSLGPFHLNLADLGFTEDLQDKIDDLQKLYKAMSVIYILGAAFAGLSILGSLVAIFLIPHSAGLIILANFLLALLSSLFLFVGNLMTTVGGKKAVDAISDKGKDVGLAAKLGNKFIAISWAAYGLITLSALFWVVEFFQDRRARKRTHVRRAKYDGYPMDEYPHRGR